MESRSKVAHDTCSAFGLKRKRPQVCSKISRDDTMSESARYKLRHIALKDRERLFYRTKAIGPSVNSNAPNAKADKTIDAKHKVEKPIDTIKNKEQSISPAQSFGPPLRVIWDQEDGVERCPMCSWELNNRKCNPCGFQFDDNGELAWAIDNDDDTE